LRTIKTFTPLFLLFLVATSAQSAMTYRRTTTTRNGFHRPPVIEHITASGSNRRLVVENPFEPFTYDVLLSGDGGKTVTALNTKLQTWYTLTDASPKARPAAIPGIQIEFTDIKANLVEEAGAEPINGFTVRKFVVHGSFTSAESYGGTKVKRIHTVTAIIWTTDKLEGSLGFPLLSITVGEKLDAELRQKIGAITGFPLRKIVTIARAYEGGQPTVEMISEEVDDVATIAAPPASLFMRPANYANQEPVIGGFSKIN